MRISTVQQRAKVLVSSAKLEVFGEARIADTNHLVLVAIASGSCEVV